MKIIAPSENPEEYVNRKGYHSINVQLLVDSNYLIARWPGSVHDSRVLRRSALYELMEDGNINGFILGDSGYACLPWLMTPLAAPATPAEINYNRFMKSFLNKRVEFILRFFCLFELI